MMSWVLSLAVVALLTLPPLAFAQPRPATDPSVVEAPSASPPTGPERGAGAAVQIEQKRTRHVVLPRQPIEGVVEDSETVREEITATQRQDALIRQGRERSISRPELDYSITSGIQSQNALKARH